MKKVLLPLCFILFIISSAYGRTIHVTASGNDSNDGDTWGTAYQTLQKALDMANPGDDIWVAAGTYIPTNACFGMKDGVAVYGSFAGTETSLSQRTSSIMRTNKSILSGDIQGSSDDVTDPGSGITTDDRTNNVYHIIYNVGISASAVLDGFTIAYGYADNSDVSTPANDIGGGMLNINSSPVIRNCSFEENLSQNGGAGIYNVNSSPSINNCSFYMNTGGVSGGAVYYDNSSKAVINNCLFAFNTATMYGGALRCSGTETNKIINSLFMGNQSTNGGAVVNENGCTTEFVNCTFNGNYASLGTGAAIYNNASILTVINSILWGDQKMLPTMVYASSEIEGSGGTYNVSYSCIEGGYTGTGNNAINPVFADPSTFDGTFTTIGSFALQKGSRCIGSGTTTGADVPSTDILGITRGTNPDMGAIENTLDRPYVFVMESAAGLNNGTNWTNAYKSLQSALTASVSGDEIWVAAGTYYPSASDRAVSFQLKNGVKIFGGFEGSAGDNSNRNIKVFISTLCGDFNNTPADKDDDSYHIVTGSAGINNTAVLDGFTITHGNANGTSDNYGGGILLNNANPDISNCTISDNFASAGGAGIFNNSSSPAITGCTFRNNISEIDGGGILNYLSNTAITNCIFSGNICSGGNGGAIQNYGKAAAGSPVIKNCLFIWNRAALGGGIDNRSGSTPEIINCTFSNNYAYTQGGAIYNEALSSSTPSMLKNSIFWNDLRHNVDLGSDVTSEIFGGITANYTYCCIMDGNITDYPGTGNIFVNPLFNDTDVEDYSLKNNSPCISAGSTADAPTSDILGTPRTGTHPDMGAYENPLDAPLPVTLTSFTAKLAEEKVMLNWATATEVNNYGFEIERSLVIGHQSLANWEKVGFVQGNGNSYSQKQYSFTDENPPAGNLQYRLKQIDTDGGFEYYGTIAEVNYCLTDIKEIKLPTEFSLEQNYPNPFNPVTTIKYEVPAPLSLLRRGAGGEVVNQAENEPVTLKVYDILGKEVATLVNEAKAPGYYEAKFNAGNLAAGVYIYQLRTNNFISSKKLLLLK